MTHPHLNPADDRMMPKAFCRCGEPMRWTGDMYAQGLTQLYRFACPNDCTGFIAWLGYQDPSQSIIDHDYNEAQVCPSCTKRAGGIDDVVNGSDDSGDFSLNLYLCEWCGHRWNDT